MVENHILITMKEADYNPSPEGEVFIAGLIGIVVIVFAIGILGYFLVPMFF